MTNEDVDMVLDLTQDERMVITDGVSFVKSISRAYGASEGLALWDKIAEGVRDEVKQAIFMAMLTGDYDDAVFIRASNTDRIVACVKIIRYYTGLGLADSKALFDQSRHGWVRIRVGASDRQECLTELRREGMEVR